MQQSLTDTVPYEGHRTRRTQRPTLMKRPQLLFMIALVVIDFGVTWLAYYLGHSLLQANQKIIIGPYLEFWPLSMVHGIVLIGILFTQKMYERRRAIAHLDEIFRIFLFHTLAVLFTVALLTLGNPSFTYHRQLIAYAWFFNILVLSVARVIHAQIQWQAQSRGIGDNRVLLVGGDEVGQMLIQKIKQSPKLGYQMMGVVDNQIRGNVKRILGVPILGTVADIPWVIEKYEIDEVIIGLPESSHQELVGIISLCEREKVGIRVFPDVFQIMASEVSIGDLGGLPLLTIRDVALRGWKLTLKRGMDILLSAIALVMSSPFLLLTAILVKLDSPGPVFYVQERMGLDARPFKILKFRSMRIDAEQSGPGWTTENDPRKTKLGNFMRSTGIDELPQLINVFFGDMSLVGPRPERPVYVEQFRQSIPRYMDRHQEKAGMTGWAQVNGLRGDTSIVERTKYDLWYIENWSLALDFKILIQTAIQFGLGTNKNGY